MNFSLNYSHLRRRRRCLESSYEPEILVQKESACVFCSNVIRFRFLKLLFFSLHFSTSSRASFSPTPSTPPCFFLPTMVGICGLTPPRSFGMDTGTIASMRPGPVGCKPTSPIRSESVLSERFVRGRRGPQRGWIKSKLTWRIARVFWIMKRARYRRFFCCFYSLR